MGASAGPAQVGPCRQALEHGTDAEDVAVLNTCGDRLGLRGMDPEATKEMAWLRPAVGDHLHVLGRLWARNSGDTSATYWVAFGQHWDAQTAPTG